MPRFHFNVYDGVTAIDPDGTILATVQDARAQAMRLAGELLISEAGKSRLGEEWRVEATDGRGMVLFRVDIVVSGSAAVGHTSENFGKTN